MLEILEFVFSSFLIFVGTEILLMIIFFGLTCMLEAFSAWTPVKITHFNKNSKEKEKEEK